MRNKVLQLLQVIKKLYTILTDEYTGILPNEIIKLN